MRKNILQYLEENVDKYPGNISFADKDTQLTYIELLNRSKSVGSFLSGRAVPGTAVFVYMEKSAEVLTAYFGAVYAGCFYIPIDEKMPPDRINRIIDVVGNGVIIYDSTTQKHIDEINPDCDKFKYEEIYATEIDENALGNIRKKSIDTDPVYILFTSGSTGTPKGVVICHRSVIAYSKWLKETFAFDSTTVFGNQTPFYFSMSVLDIYATISSGASLWIIPKSYFSFPKKLLEFINEKKVNTIYWVPSAMGIVAQFDAFKYVTPEYLRTVLFAGEVMPNKILNVWRKNVPNALYANLFGPTEITDIGIYYTVNRDFADDEPLPIGGVCDNVGILVVNDKNELITKAGDKGELYIRGSFLSHGYYNNPEKTKESFVNNPINNSYPEVVYKTGDIVYYNELGELMYAGRKDFQIKHMGNRIELGEIENSFSAIAGVDRCCCLYDPDEDMIIGVYSGSAEAKCIMDILSEKLPAYMIPNKYEKLDILPLNSNGKIDRKLLTMELIKK